MTQLEAMALSLALEAPVAAAAAWAWRLAPWRAALAAVGGTLATHWPLWRVFASAAAAVGYWPAVVLLEAAVTLVEAVGYRLLLRRRWRVAVVLSLLANAASTALGLVIYWLGWA
jgi:hypothetical protein